MSNATRARVADIMTRGVLSLRDDQTLFEVRELMGEHQIRNVPILDDSGRPIGLATQKNVLREVLTVTDQHGYAQLDHHLAQIPLSQVLEPDFNTVSSGTPLVEAGRLLLNYRQVSLPVVDDGTLVGILSLVDYVRVFVDRLEAEVLSLA